MNKKYTISIDAPQKKSEMWSAFCKEWGFVAEDKSPHEALIGLLDAIRIAEEDKDKQKEGKTFFKKTEFSIPAFS